jgi:hypothetical protein
VKEAKALGSATVQEKEPLCVAREMRLWARCGDVAGRWVGAGHPTEVKAVADAALTRFELR